MKKRIILLLVCYMLMCGALTGCGETTVTDDNTVLEVANFSPVLGMDGVVYSLDTRVMFYMFNTIENGEYYWATGYGYFGPYISENGRYCRYVDGEIVEIVVEYTEN